MNYYNYIYSYKWQGVELGDILNIYDKFCVIIYNITGCNNVLLQYVATQKCKRVAICIVDSL